MRDIGWWSRPCDLTPLNGVRSHGLISSRRANLQTVCKFASRLQNKRSERELLTIGRAVDHILKGVPYAALDVLMQRYKALELGAQIQKMSRTAERRQGAWQRAAYLARARAGRRGSVGFSGRGGSSRQGVRSTRKSGGARVRRRKEEIRVRGFFLGWLTLVRRGKEEGSKAEPDILTKHKLHENLHCMIFLYFFSRHAFSMAQRLCCYSWAALP